MPPLPHRAADCAARDGLWQRARGGGVGRADYRRGLRRHSGHGGGRHPDERGRRRHLLGLAHRAEPGAHGAPLRLEDRERDDDGRCLVQPDDVRPVVSTGWLPGDDRRRRIPRDEVRRRGDRGPGERRPPVRTGRRPPRAARSRSCRRGVLSFPEWTRRSRKARRTRLWDSERSTTWPPPRGRAGGSTAST